jgi:uncharacterized protein (DUF433 family)
VDDDYELVNLEGVFDFHDPDGIRYKGHRIWIETILFDYLDGLSPIEMALRYPSLSLNQIHAAIQYYRQNRSGMDQYLKSVEERDAAARAEQDANPPPVVRRLLELREQARSGGGPESPPPERSNDVADDEKTDQFVGYLDFDDPDGIRIKGHRVWIETIVCDYLDGMSPIEIVLRHPTLSPVEVEVTIEYYKRNRASVDAYLRKREEDWARARQAQELDPPPGLLRLRELARKKDRARSLDDSPIRP